jgi:hypothetical protein
MLHRESWYAIGIVATRLAAPFRTGVMPRYAASPRGVAFTTIWAACMNRSVTMSATASMFASGLHGSPAGSCTDTPGRENGWGGLDCFASALLAWLDALGRQRGAQRV